MNRGRISTQVLLYFLIMMFLMVIGCGKSEDTRAPATYNISGAVSGATLAGVTINLTGAATASATTDASGNFSFTGRANGTYTVTPVKAGYTFNPVSSVVVVSGASVTNTNFVATATSVSTYSISGTVAGAVQAGVTITLSGSTTGTAITNASGNYSFSGLADGNYTVTPSLTGYTFTPANLSITVSGANSTGNNFTSVAVTPPATYSISGAVSGATLAGVTINLTGAATTYTTTNASGNFSITGLANGAYTVTPVKPGYTFTPTSSAVNVSGANITGTNFTAAANPAPTYSISGVVSGDVLSGVTITLSGAGSATTTTNASGNYSFSGIANGSYTVTPSRTGYTFSPASSAVNVSGANITGTNFVATAVQDLPIKLFNAGVSPWINDIMEDSSNNILVAGEQDDARSIVVLKLSSAGTQVWNKYFPAGTIVKPNNIFEVPSQGYLVTGSIYSTLGSLFKMPIDPDGTNSAPSYFFPDCGYPYWATGPWSSDSVRLSDGSVIFAGATQYKNNCGIFIDYGNALITGINSSGTQYFWNDYNYASGYSENFESVIALSGGGFAAAGQARLYDDGSGYPGPENAILVKTDSLGHVIWTKNYGYKSDDLGNGGIIDLIQTSDNGYGMLARLGYNYSMYVIKADSSGNSTSAFNAATGDSCYKGEKFVQSGDNGFVIVGQGAGCHGAVVKMSAAGAKVWEYNLDSGEPTAIVKSASGGYLIAGHVASAGVYKIFVFKLDDLGKRVW